MLRIEQIPILSDNYSYVIHDQESQQTAVVDPGEAETILKFLAKQGWKLDFIYNTHHHPDHVGGNLALQRETGCTIYGPLKDKHRVPGIQHFLAEGDTLSLGSSSAKIMEMPGHTNGHIAIYFMADKALFSGDMIFSLGSGFLFEGTPSQMWNSLARLRELPDDTIIFGAHEYTLDNSLFALTLEPRNVALLRMIERAKSLRGKGLATVPTTMLEEKQTNPFLRPDSRVIQEKLGKLGAPLDEVFAAIRFGKDAFDQGRKNK